MGYKRRRTAIVSVLSLLVGAVLAYQSLHANAPTADNNATIPQSQAPASGSAARTLEKLAIKGRAPKTGYSRDQFGDGWAELGNCNVREHVLARDMINVILLSPTDCRVRSGTLHDPYTGSQLIFSRGPSSSSAVQIDHVVALSNAWQTGAQQLSAERRQQLANDPLELLAVDGPANMQKGDGDAATWLPANKDYRCRYVARQVAVKEKYGLWVTQAEHDAIKQVLQSCPEQMTPTQG